MMIDEMIEKILNYGREMTKEEEMSVKFLKEEVRRRIKKEKETENKNSITVKQLFNRVNFERVFRVAKEKFKAIDGVQYNMYLDIYENVLKQEEEEPSALIHYVSEGGLNWDVFSTNFDSVIHYGVDLVPYKEIANMKVDKRTTEKFKNEEIVAAFLEEFSWHPKDESKNAYEEQLEEIKEIMAHSKFEQECEENDVIPITKKQNNSEGVDSFSTIEDFMKGKLDEEGEKNGETIRDFVNNTNSKKVREEFVKIIETFDEQNLLIEKEKALKFFNDNYFLMMQNVNSKEKSLLNQKVKTDITVDYLVTVNDDSEYSCVYNGKNVLSLIDEEMEQDYMFLLSNEEQIVAEFFVAYNADDLMKHSARCYDEEEFISIIKKKNKARKIFRRIIENYDVVNELTKEELEIAYYYLEIFVE